MALGILTNIILKNGLCALKTNYKSKLLHLGSTLDKIFFGVNQSRIYIQGAISFLKLYNDLLNVIYS